MVFSKVLTGFLRLASVELRTKGLPTPQVLSYFRQNIFVLSMDAEPTLASPT